MTIDKGIPPNLEGKSTTKILQKFSADSEVWRRHFHARDFAYCPRKAILSCTINRSTTSSWDTKSEFYTSIGNAVHKAVCRILRSEGVLLNQELRIENDWLDFGGYIDAIVKIDDSIQIIEIKTCGKLPTSPYNEHQFQVATYGLLTGIEDTRILYVSRNVMSYPARTLEIAEFRVPASLQKDALNNMAITKAFWDLKLIPPIPTNIKSSRQCNFCPFKAFCWEGNKSPQNVFDIWSGRDVKQQLDEAKEGIIKVINSGDVFAGDGINTEPLPLIKSDYVEEEEDIEEEE